MSAIRIFAIVGAVLLASAGTVAVAADQAAAPEQSGASANPGMSAPTGESVTAPTMVAAGDSGATASQIDALRAGDNRLVTNGPVPDTAANRARFGGPRSHAGKKTAPSGN